MRETYSPEELDEIMVGDKLINSVGMTQDVYRVVETDVIGEMRVPSEGDGVAEEQTVGVRVESQGVGPSERLISYRVLAEEGLYEVARKAEDLTEEQIESLRAEHA